MRRLRCGHALAALLLPTLLGACGSNSTRPGFDPQIVVFGYLYVGEPVSGLGGIHLGRTMPVDEHYDVGQAAILNAFVTLRADSAVLADTLPRMGTGVYGNPAVIIRAKTTYHLEIRVDGKTITATTTTPAAFETPREPRVMAAGVMRQSAIADSFPIVVACPDPGQIFLVDVWCAEDWQNARFIHRIGGEDTPQSYDEYGGANGEPRHIAAYFRLRECPQSNEGYRVSFYGDMMWFYGQYRVGVFSIDENYYNYLYRDHPERSGGINGGIGVFGSACRKQYSVKVVE
jgi:hypothetical protein